jgi:hypothetical protein
VALCFAAPVAAQETREEQLAARQAEKATRLRPYEPEALERRLDRLDSMLFAPERSVYPFIGSVFGGGGLAVGPGYRTRFGGSGSIDAHAAWSIKNVKAAELTVQTPTIPGIRRVGLALRASWLDAPDVSYYGVGNDTPDVELGGFSYRNTTVGVAARMQATPLLAVGGGFDVMAMSSGPANIATDLVRPTYGRGQAFAEVDWRESARFTRRGGLYRVSWSDFRQMNGSAYSFGRLDAEAQQFFPIMRENWVIATRALASSTMTGDNSVVPTVLLPDLGGGRTLRGYPAWRFRDRHRLLLTGEYRWSASSFIDMSLFIDAGKVAAEAGDLNLSGLTKTYGIGASFHTPTSTVMRVELAQTPDGTSLVLSFGPSF